MVRLLLSDVGLRSSLMREPPNVWHDRGGQPESALALEQDRLREETA